MEKIILSIFTLILLMTSCSKEENTTRYATDNVVPEGWVTDNQIIVINEKSFNITVASDPKGEGIKFLNEPFEIRTFFETHEETIIPYVVLAEKGKIVFYFRNVEDFKNHVNFMDSNSKELKSYRGATVTAFQHGYINSNNVPQGYGNALQDRNDVWKTYWYSPVGGAIAQAYGKMYCYVGGSLNDELSVIHFYLNNGEEPVTFVGYLDAHGSYGDCNVYAGGYFNTDDPKQVIAVTKLAANKPNGTWIGSNSVALWQIKRKIIKSWNDCISAYHFYQTPITQPANVYLN